MSEAATFTPASVAEAAEAIREAQADGTVLLPCGRRSRIARHAPQAAPERWLSLSGLRALRWLDVEDQTCEVEAGMSPQELAVLLDAHGLELAVDAPCAQDGTLGGLFLAPDVSLLHTSCGPPRDQVLGAEWLLADGTRIQSGARVVKSVAGYDLTRLLLGSRGRLAACTALTLRLRPQPRRSAWFRGDDPVAWRRATGAVARRAVQAGEVGARLHVEYVDGDLPPEGLLETVDEVEGQAARAAVLRGFAAHSHRMAESYASSGHRHGGADWNALQFAGHWHVESERHQGVIPHPAESPWLAPLAEACAPGALPFGGRA